MNNNLYRYGESVVGPFVIEFCKWINKIKKEHNKDILFFLSRDGYEILNVYKQLYPGEKAEYLQVSRKALRICLMSELSYESFCRTVPPFRNYTQFMIIDIMGVRDMLNESVEDISVPELTNLEVPYKDLVFSSELRQLFFFIKNKYKYYYENQHMLFKRYLNEKHFSGAIGLVDLSFKGTSLWLLNELSDTYGIRATLDEYSLGRVDECWRRIGDLAKNLHGYLFQTEKDNPIAYLMLSNATLYEKFFFQNVGSVISYEEKNNKVIPVLLSQSSERANINTIEKVRKGIEEAINNYIGSNGNLRESNFQINIFFRYLPFPSRECVDTLGDMYEDNVIECQIAHPASLKEYFLSPAKFIKELKRSFWKQGFLYRLTRSKLLVYIYNLVFFYSKGIKVSVAVKVLSEINKSEKPI